MFIDIVTIISLLLNLIFAYKIVNYKKSAWIIFILSAMINILAVFAYSIINNYFNTFILMSILNSVFYIFIGLYSYYIFKEQMVSPYIPKKVRDTKTIPKHLAFMLTFIATFQIAYNLSFLNSYISTELGIIILLKLFLFLWGLILIANRYFIGFLFLSINYAFMLLYNVYNQFYYSQYSEGLSITTILSSFIFLGIYCLIFFIGYIKNIKAK
ncbi:hypothetical protein ACFPDQ_02940 [Pseudofrancisella aestuarii]|uniref:Nicotinamide mononucleotide transporter n=1 Tax=Pseudofrancisella aestuarii TaxID=2670347 RepID=A0ABV9TBR8_9GAMM|nr:hypothetical protein [Pseudofrancisella aestuarii]